MSSSCILFDEGNCDPSISYSVWIVKKVHVKSCPIREYLSFRGVVSGQLLGISKQGPFSGDRKTRSSR